MASQGFSCVGIFVFIVLIVFPCLVSGGIRDADIVLLIGPAVTIGGYIQNTARRLRTDIYKAGWCYPVKTPYEAHALGMAILNGRVPDVDLVKRIKRCVEDDKKVLLSSDKFAAMHTELEMKRVQDFFKDYKVHIVAAFRESLSMSYAWHNTIFTDSPRIVSFPEHLATAAGRYLFRTLSATLYRYDEVFGRSNITVIDYHGVEAAKKSPSYVLFCELLGILCQAEYGDLDAPHHEQDLRPSFFYGILRNTALALGCKFNFLKNKEVLTFYDLQDRYKMTMVDFSTLPMMETRVEWFGHLARYVEQDVRGKFGSVMVYGNTTASEHSRRNFKAYEVDELAFFRNSYWSSWMWQEIRRLQDVGVISKKCTVQLSPV